MLLIAALVSLAVWLVGVLVLSNAQPLIHVLLLAGLMLFLLAVLKGRDTAARVSRRD